MRARSFWFGIGAVVLAGCFEDSPMGGSDTSDPTSAGTQAATTAEPCDPGSVGCACFPNGTCNVGLQCAAGVCEPADDTTSGSATTTSADSRGSTGEGDSTSEATATTDDGGSTTGDAAAHILFTTSTSYTGLGVAGLDGADIQCTDLGQGLRVGPWVAVLRDSVTTLSSRLDVDGDVVNTNGDLLATDKAELLSGTLQARPGYDETGAPVAQQDLVWTGSTTSDCLGWTSEEPVDLGTVGLPNEPDRWLDSRVPLPCSASPRLYCISQ